jgi:chaperonin GroEL
MYPKRPGMPGTSRPRPKPRKPAIEFQPQVYQNIQKGVDLMVSTLKPTLGPLPRLVAIQGNTPTSAPEILDDGGTIARRIIQVEGRGIDLGAMLLRHYAWKMNKMVGDGSVTMAVLYQSILRGGIHHLITTDGNAMLLRNALEHYQEILCESLREKAISLSDGDQIGEIAKGLCQGDDAMADLLGEMIDIVGKDGLIEVREGSRIGLEREYIEGSYWESSGWFSANFQTDPENHRALVEDASILITDFTFKSTNELIPFLEMAVKAKIKNLIIVCVQIQDEVLGLFIKNSKSKTISVIPVRTPHIAEVDRASAMEDIAVLTGGRPFRTMAGENIEGVRIEDLGSARIAWANSTYFGVIGGKGDSRLVRSHTNNLRASMEYLEDEQLSKMKKRVGRLIGGTAILKVGGKTSSEIKIRKTVAERAVLALKNAVESGVVWGGGVALMACQDAIKDSSISRNEEDQAARRILSRALEEPLRVIASNAGYSSDSITDKVKESGQGWGFDARSGKIVDMQKAGIVDALKVIETALRIAISGAAMTLTTDVIIHRKNPPEIMEP